MGYAFNGSSQKIDFGDIADGWGTNTASFAVYVKLASWSQTTGFLNKRTNSSTQASYALFLNPGQIILQINGGAYYTWSTSGFPTNEWVSIVAWYDGNASSGNRAKLYVNGSPVSTSPTSDGTGNIQNTTSPLQIGVVNTDSLYLTGSVAEAAIWNIALTESDAEAYAAGTRPSSIEAAALEFYAPLEADSVDTITEVTGTVTGASLTDHPTMSGGGDPEPSTRKIRVARWAA